MRKLIPSWLLCISVLVFSGPSFSASEILLDDYKGGLNSKWVQKSFKGKTRYEITREDNELAVRATSSASASALYYKVKYDVKDFPLLTWRWKIDHVLSKGSALHKDSDDFAARVYVVFPSWVFWKTKAVNYIWANKLPQGKAVPNAFTSSTVMIAVESGPERTGKWVEEEVNVLEDYRRHFGEDPPRVGAIAIMTDTDNTGERATAWYGPIRILSGSSR